MKNWNVLLNDVKRDAKWATLRVKEIIDAFYSVYTIDPIKVYKDEDGEDWWTVIIGVTTPYHRFIMCWFVDEKGFCSLAHSSSTE